MSKTVSKFLFVVVASLGVVTASFAETETVGGITWTYAVSNGKATLSSVPNTTAGTITIPSRLGGYPVTSIGESAFDGRSGLQSVTIPEGITSIGSYAFWGCGLTSVTIPASVRYLGVSAFGSCNNLETVVFLGDAPFAEIDAEDGDGPFYQSPGGLTIFVPRGSLGWLSGSSSELPNLWPASDGRNIRYSEGSSSGETSTGDASYSLSNIAGDRSIASVTIDGNSAIDSFVLRDGKVYDSVVRIINTAPNAVRVTLPEGYTYETFKGTDPLTIPANSRNILTITRTAARTFLVSRRELEIVK